MRSFIFHYFLLNRRKGEMLSGQVALQSVRAVSVSAAKPTQNWPICNATFSAIVCKRYVARGIFGGSSLFFSLRVFEPQHFPSPTFWLPSRRQTIADFEEELRKFLSSLNRKDSAQMTDSDDGPTYSTDLVKCNGVVKKRRQLSPSFPSFAHLASVPCTGCS